VGHTTGDNADAVSHVPLVDKTVGVDGCRGLCSGYARPSRTLVGEQLEDAEEIQHDVDQDLLARDDAPALRHVIAGGVRVDP